MLTLNGGEIVDSQCCIEGEKVRHDNPRCRRGLRDWRRKKRLGMSKDDIYDYDDDYDDDYDGSD